MNFIPNRAIEVPGLNGHVGEAKLKICMLAACPFPANHGTPGSIREIAEAITERGHEVHIVTYHIGEEIPVRGPRVHRIPPLTRETSVVVGPTVRRPLYDLQMVFKALEVIRRYRPDLIHAHSYEAALIAGLCRLVTGLPILFSGHCTMTNELASYQVIRPKWLADGLARFLDAVVPRIGNRCLPHSTNIREFFSRQGLNGRVEPIVNFGIDLALMTGGDGMRVRQRYGLDGGPVILYAGVLDQFQRLDLLLEAMKMVTFYEPQARLLLVVTIPNDKHVAQIRARAAELEISHHLVVTEPQALDSIRDYLKACDVAVVPRPQAPGFPIKLLNYMAASKPCVLFASSASQGLLHRDNVFLAAPDTSQALGEAILEVLRDSALRRQLACAGHRFVCQNHDRRLVAQQICSAYLRTLAATGRSLPPERPRVFPALPTREPNRVPSTRVNGLVGSKEILSRVPVSTNG